MLGRHLPLVVRIALVPVVLLSPVGLLIASVFVIPGISDGIGTVLVMAYLVYLVVAVMVLPALFVPGPAARTPVRYLPTD